MCARECVFFAVSLVKFLALFCTYFQQFVPCICVCEWVRSCVSICFNRLRCAQCACVCVCVWTQQRLLGAGFANILRHSHSQKFIACCGGRTGFSDLLFYCGLSVCVCAWHICVRVPYNMYIYMYCISHYSWFHRFGFFRLFCTLSPNLGKAFTLAYALPEEHSGNQNCWPKCVSRAICINSIAKGRGKEGRGGCIYHLCRGRRNRSRRH